MANLITHMDLLRQYIHSPGAKVSQMTGLLELTLLALEAGFDMLEFGDIGGETGKAIGLALIIHYRKGSVLYPAHLTIGAYNAVDFPVATLDLTFQSVIYSRAIFGMNSLKPGDWIVYQALTASAPDFFIGGRNIEHGLLA